MRERFGEVGDGGWLDGQGQGQGHGQGVVGEGNEDASVGCVAGE